MGTGDRMTAGESVRQIMQQLRGIVAEAFQPIKSDEDLAPSPSVRKGPISV